MATIITNAGESLIARRQAEGSPLILNRFILAYAPGQDPDANIDRAEARPPDDQIVYTYAIPDDFRGYVSPNRVVYSMLLGSDVGDFTFNWVGLAADDGSIVTITHLPDTRKWATSGQTLGNNLTRNVLLEFTGALTTTGVTIEAKTWQVDFTARLHGIDERARLAGADLYGRSCFFGESYRLVEANGQYSLAPGVAYVAGVRVRLDAAQPVNLGALPKVLWLDVALTPDGSDLSPTAAPVAAAPDVAKEDYTDEANVRHWLVQAAGVSAAGAVTDLRRVEDVETDVVQYLKNRAAQAVQGISLESLGAASASALAAHVEDTDDPHKTLPEGGEDGQVLAAGDDGKPRWREMQGAPTGAVLAYGASLPPDGWLECDGSALSRTTYADLYAVIGTTFGYTSSSTFKLPDLRGEFLRGWDHGRGVDADSSRALGSAQAYAIENITGRFQGVSSEDRVAASGVFRLGSTYAGAGANPQTKYVMEFDASRMVNTSTETRPANTAVMYVMKY
ncbi:MAG: hypothetical protein PWQ57_2031 [Desulfovibrionales bacterium]|nr:hypothetical protein [Desulfovibrionales bacterium]